MSKTQLGNTLLNMRTTLPKGAWLCGDISRKAQGVKGEIWSQMAWVQLLASFLTHYVTLGEFLDAMSSS